MLSAQQSVASGVIRNVSAATLAASGTLASADTGSAAGDDASLGTIADAALAWRDGTIEYVGPARDLPAAWRTVPAFDGGGGWLTPGLVDCHTHVVHAGHRAGEFAARLAGDTYAAIVARGGGILSTVRATRAASADELIASALPRVDGLLASGVTTLEVKSGYGLELATERRMLQAARELGRLRRVRVRTTFLGAHVVAPEYAGRADEYVALLCDAMLPALHAEGLVDAVDAYCEHNAFSLAQVDRLYAAAARLGLPVKIHAEQFSAAGGAALAARHGALSADHLEHLDADGIAALRAAGTVAVLLPGAYYWMRETRAPPVAALRAAGVPIAIASDCNPGTSPLSSLTTAMNMACVLFGLSPAEALAATTREAARALGLPAGSGTLVAGAPADLALWRIAEPAELSYALGTRPLVQAWVAGVPRH